jgi:altronate dehydratase
MEDGVTTLEERSLCAVQRAGTVMVADVLDYGERDIAIWKRGVTR